MYNNSTIQCFYFISERSVNNLKGLSTFVVLLDLSLKGQMYTFSLNQNVGGGKHQASEVENIYTFQSKRKSMNYLWIQSRVEGRGSIFRNTFLVDDSIRDNENDTQEITFTSSR